MKRKPQHEIKLRFVYDTTNKGWCVRRLDANGITSRTYYYHHQTTAYVAESALSVLMDEIKKTRRSLTAIQVIIT